MNLSIDILIIALLAFAILLLVLSFFKRNKQDELEQQIEQLSLQMMQENYKIKKQLAVLEEEIIGHPLHKDDVR